MPFGMPYPASELIDLALRWLHVVAAIFWIGQTALFTWLDTRLRVEGDEHGRQVWMVHGGGFYRVEKLPWQAPPRLLHWFRWEAAVTWISGFLLLVWVYWLGEILVPPGGAVGPVAAMGLSLAVLLGGPALYDALWMSPLARRERAAVAVSFALLVVLAWGLTEVFTGRGAYLQVGATLGTVMTANVWVRILPAMRDAVAAARAGRALDAGLQARVARAGQRSRHNTFLAFPVVFLMISTHYPVTTYGHRWNWLLLAVFTLVGMGARWLVNRHEARPARPTEGDA